MKINTSKLHGPMRAKKVSEVLCEYSFFLGDGGRGDLLTRICGGVVPLDLNHKLTLF